MSIEGITNYEHFNRWNVRPVWETLERLDYCEQRVSTMPAWMEKITSFFRDLF